MPGHVKLGKAGEPDPDPCPYLVVTLEMKREDAMKPYDPKKSYWCPDGKGGYMESMLEADDGTKAVVMCGHEVKLPSHCSFNSVICILMWIILNCRKRLSSLLKWAKSTLPSLRSVKTWLT